MMSENIITGTFKSTFKKLQEDCVLQVQKDKLSTNSFQFS